MGDPGAEEESGHAVPGGVGDFDLGDIGEVFESAGVLEAGGEGGAEEVGAGPTEVTDIEVCGFTFEGRSEGGEFGGGVLPEGAVDDEGVDVGVEGFVEVAGEGALPENDEGEVGVEMSEDDVLDGLWGGLFEDEGDLLGADDLLALVGAAEGVDEGAGVWGGGVGEVENEEGAAGVLGGDGLEQLHVAGEVGGGFGVDSEVDEGGAGFGAVVFPEFGEGFVDAGEGDLHAEACEVIFGEGGEGHGAVGLICEEGGSGVLAENAERPQEGRDDQKAAKCSRAEGEKATRAVLSDAVGRDDLLGQAQPKPVAKIRPKSGTGETQTPSEK